MTGRHEVKTFPYYPHSSIPLRLPEGWKPFSSYQDFDVNDRLVLYVVCRKWIRAEKVVGADPAAA